MKLSLQQFDFGRLAETFSGKTLIRHGERVIFYRDLPGEIVPRVSRLRMLGIEEGLRVALVGENSPEMLLEMAALWQIGAVAVPLNYHLPETRLRQLTEMLDCRLLLCDPDRRGDLGGIPVESLAVEKPGPGIDSEGALPAFDPHRTATIIFTSGSTGEPRGAVHTLANHLHSAAGSATNIPLQPGDAWLLPLPLFHVGGLAIWVRCLLAGASVEIPTSKDLLGEIATGRISHLSLVATQLKRLMDEHPPEAALAGVRVLLLGGSAIPRALLAEGFRRGWPLVTSYGSTEMSSQITATRPGGSWPDLLTSGSVLPGRELSIAPDGEILVRGETRFLGYFRDGRIEDPCDSQGWLHTGDTGFLDEGERLIVSGRLDNMFICGGENIQPEEIEQILRAQPGVGEALVVPLSDREYGAVPVAFIDCSPPIDVPHLQRQLRKLLPGLKVPRHFLAWPQSPPRVGIKLDREGFRNLAESCLQPGN